MQHTSKFSLPRLIGLPSLIGLLLILMVPSLTHAQGDNGVFTFPPDVTDVSGVADYGNTAGGKTVTITGMWFTDASAVSIDGYPATNVTVLSNTSMTATTPAHAAASGLSVRVVGPGGYNADNTLFTYYDVPPR